MSSPEENWRRNRGVIIGPGVGLAAGTALSVLAPDVFPAGVWFSLTMGAGLVLGAIYDLVARRREK